MSELIERLQKTTCWISGDGCGGKQLQKDASNEIERLQARVEALESALHEIAEYERDFPLFAIIAKTAIAGA